MLAEPEMEAHSPEEERKAMLIEGSEARSSVLPDSVLVWKRRSIPQDSWRGRGSVGGLIKWEGRG